MAVQDFVNGANILQQVDVSQIFKSLAMGIAEAQQELDDNSISQLERLSETELAGKSLLELGFVPAFYSFTYADISASIHLRMAEKTSFELGASASFDFASGSASESDFSDISKESQFFSEKEEFKSNRKFSMKSSSTKKVKVNNQFYEMNQSEGCVSKFETMHNQLLADEKIERVNIQMSNAYTTVYQPLAAFSILKITNFAGAGISSPSIAITGLSFATVFASVSAAYGFIGSQVYGLSVSPLEMDFFFDFDKRVIDFGYDETYSGINNKDLAFEALANILRMDPSLSITIEGYTDSSGKNSYNDGLSTDRCNAMRSWLVSKGAAQTQINITPKGETLAVSNGGPDSTKNPLFRKVSIKLPAGKCYIYYNTVISTSETIFAPATPNYFIISPALPLPALVIINGNASGFISTGTSISSIVSDNTSLATSKFQTESRENIQYFLNKETDITYMTYSEESEEIQIVAEEGSTEEIKVYQNENSKERIKNLATKNNSNRTFAASASIDFRFSRQFEMSVEGSASMSAHMVAVPPPEAFTLHIATAFNPPTP